MGVLNRFLDAAEFDALVTYHYQLSRGLGTPIGVIKLFSCLAPDTLSIADTASSSIDEAGRFPTESLFDRMQKLLLMLLLGQTTTFSSSRSEESKIRKPLKSDSNQVDTQGLIVPNELKANFLSLLQSKDDDLLL